MAAVVIWVIFGFITRSVAKAKGRNEVGWFFAGVLFGVFALLVISVLPSNIEQRNYRDHVNKETTALKEQIKQERIKAEALRGHVVQRLDIHDKVLGLDTKKTSTGSSLISGNEITFQLNGALQDQPASEPQSATSTAVPPPSKRETVIVTENPKVSQAWYYENNGKQFGPISTQEILVLLRNGILTSTALLWREGFQDWTPAKEVTELHAWL